MNTKAVRLHGVCDLRLDELELPPITDEEILAKVYADGLCTSTYKEVKLGEKHARVKKLPIIVGHEFSGELIEVGKRWQKDFKPGDRFTVQPDLDTDGVSRALGYSYEFAGGDATYIILPKECMEKGCLIKYSGEGFFKASVLEPYACVYAAFRAMYHIEGDADFVHRMGIKQGGNVALLGGTGPMGTAGLDLLLHADVRPARIAVLGHGEKRLSGLKKLLSAEYAQSLGIELLYISSEDENVREKLLDFTNGEGFSDAVLFAPIAEIAELADGILGKDGCLNIFAGAADKSFSANINLYNSHYKGTHIMGTTGSSAQDMKDCLSLMEQGRLHPEYLVTHIGGLDAAITATLELPKIGGGKKLIYPQINMPLTAIADFPEKGKTDPFFGELAKRTPNGLWTIDAEQFLLK